MKKSLPKEPMDYLPEELSGEKSELIYALQIGFHRYICSKLFPVAVTRPDGSMMAINLASVSEALQLLEINRIDLTGSVPVLVNPRLIQNWFMQKGAIESASKAAYALSEDYDIGIGIAKKGLWLSFMFAINGFSTKDLVVVRSDGLNRLVAPMDAIDRSMIEGKRILLFDNDAITGSSVLAVAQTIYERASPEYLDLLLISRYAHITDECYSQVKDKLTNRQHLGRTIEGKHVVDTLSQIPSKFIRRKMTLEQDFHGGKKDMQRLRIKVGI